MFEDPINSLNQTKNEFDGVVKDVFGKSIDENVFEPVEKELHSLENEYSIAEMKKNEIMMLTLELRTII
jgi:hypothetical protein